MGFRSSKGMNGAISHLPRRFDCGFPDGNCSERHRACFPGKGFCGGGGGGGVVGGALISHPSIPIPHPQGGRFLAPLCQVMPAPLARRVAMSDSAAVLKIKTNTAHSFRGVWSRSVLACESRLSIRPHSAFSGFVLVA